MEQSVRASSHNAHIEHRQGSIDAADLDWLARLE